MKLSSFHMGETNKMGNDEEIEWSRWTDPYEGMTEEEKKEIRQSFYDNKMDDIEDYDDKLSHLVK